MHYKLSPRQIARCCCNDCGVNVIEAGDYCMLRPPHLAGHLRARHNRQPVPRVHREAPRPCDRHRRRDHVPGRRGLSDVGHAACTALPIQEAEAGDAEEDQAARQQDRRGGCAMNKELNIGLLPCPFCGGRNLRVQIERRDVPADAMGQGMSAGTVYHEAIWCDVCGVFPHGREWWNRRTGHQQ